MQLFKSPAPSTLADEVSTAALPSCCVERSLMDWCDPVFLVESDVTTARRIRGQFANVYSEAGGVPSTPVGSLRGMSDCNAVGSHREFHRDTQLG